MYSYSFNIKKGMKTILFGMKRLLLSLPFVIYGKYRN